MRSSAIAWGFVAGFAALGLSAPTAHAEEPPPPEAAPAAPAAAPKSDAPWSQGKVRVGVGGGASINLASTAFQVNTSVGYFFIDYLEAGVDLAFQFGSGDVPFTIVLGPALRLLIPVDKHIMPYLGAFYHHYFVVDSDFADLDTAGARAGIAFRTQGANVQIGILWEHVLSACTDECDIFMPEIGVTFVF